MVLMKFNSIQKEILCGALKNPDMSVKELADFLDMNYWTVYKSLEKMKKEGVYREVIIPDFHSLGFELLVVGYGSLNKKKMNNLQKVKNIRDYPPFSSGIFYSFAESYRGFVIAVSKNFTEVFKGLIYAERLIKVREFLQTENTRMIIFPFELTEIPMFFDYAPLICKDFNIEMEGWTKNSEEKKPLKGKEFDVLLQLVKNPSNTVSSIARYTGLSQQSVSKIKSKLFKQGWLSRKIIPNLAKMGYDVLVFAHWTSNPDPMEKLKRKDLRKFGYDLSNIVFAAYNSLEGVALAPFKTLKESRDIVSFFEKLGEETGVLTKEPNILFLSLQEGIKIKDHVYYPILRSFISSRAIRTSKATP